MKIGIIGAMEVEVATLKSNMTVKNTVKKASMEFYEKTIKAKQMNEWVVFRLDEKQFC